MWSQRNTKKLEILTWKNYFSRLHVKDLKKMGKITVGIKLLNKDILSP